MKYRSMIKVIAGAGLAAGSMSVLASGFGGGWMQDRDTGTLYYSLAPTPPQQPSASSGHQKERLNSFGGGWVQDRNTGTLTYLHSHTDPHASKADGNSTYSYSTDQESSHEQL